VFVKSNFYDVIGEYIETGEIPEEKGMFEDFGSFLGNYGIVDTLSVFSYSNYVTFFVKMTTDVKPMARIINTYQDEIANRFMELLGVYNISTEYEKMQLGPVYSFESCCMNRLLRKCKDEIINNMKERNISMPRYVFCSSGSDCVHLSGIETTLLTPPSICFIYEDTHFIKTERGKITEICMETLKNHDRTGYYSSQRIDMVFTDVAGERNLYGLSRED